MSEQPVVRSAVVRFFLLAAVSMLGTAEARAPDKADLQRAMKQMQEISQDYFDHPRSGKAEAYIRQRHAQVAAQAKADPEARRVAQVVFRRGLSSRELYALSREFHLAVHEAKVVFVCQQWEFASSVGMTLIWRSDDTLDKVIDKFVGEYRGLFASRAEATGNSQYYECMAKKSKALVISAGLSGKADLLRLLSEEPEVYVVVMDPSAERMRILDDLRSRSRGPAIQDRPGRSL